MQILNLYLGILFLVGLLLNNGIFGEILNYPAVTGILCILGLIAGIANSYKIYKLKKGGLPWI
ncbi:TMhelix containing protein [Vibrio phage 1.161.O._10N.261.48.C5]|nr:TMhelix containing protein [Vibrio phage 1.161.O._10N.261.48.C5]